MTPQQARQQVMDAAHQVVTDLGLKGDLVKATFSYEPCHDGGKGSYRGRVTMVFWMPGADRSLQVDPGLVFADLQRHGWSADPEFRSHATAMRKNYVDLAVTVVQSDGPPPVGHVIADLSGECRDISDHSRDPFDPGDVTAELES